VSIVRFQREGVRKIGQGDRRHKAYPAPSNAAAAVLIKFLGDVKLSAPGCRFLGGSAGHQRLLRPENPNRHAGHREVAFIRALGSRQLSRANVCARGTARVLVELREPTSMKKIAKRTQSRRRNPGESHPSPARRRRSGSGPWRSRRLRRPRVRLARLLAPGGVSAVFGQQRAAASLSGVLGRRDRRSIPGSTGSGRRPPARPCAAGRERPPSPLPARSAIALIAGLGDAAACARQTDEILFILSGLDIIRDVGGV
jgi:hypothetical protein